MRGGMTGGGDALALPDDVWREVVKVEPWGGKLARMMACTSRRFAALVTEHEDLSGSQPTPAAPRIRAPPGSAQREGFYACAECGDWVATDMVIDEALQDVYGYPIRMCDVRAARGWMLAHGPSPWDPEGFEDGWEWHPVRIEERACMQGILDAWPGDVCRRCWRECAECRRNVPRQKRGELVDLLVE